MTVIGTATTQEGAPHHAIIASQQPQVQDDVERYPQASVDKVLDTIKEKFGAVNVLVNNAAITQDNLVTRMKEEEWSQVIDTDLNSVSRLTKGCVRNMVKRAGEELLYRLGGTTAILVKLILCTKGCFGF